MSTTPQIHQSLTSVLDARAAGLAEADLIVRLHTPEIDSLVEEITFAPDIPAARKLRLLGYVQQIADLNATEGEHERAAAGLLDQLATAEHRAECERLTDTLGVLALARALRPHLAVIAAPSTDDGVAFFVAAAGLRDITRAVTPSRLAAPSLRNQLGAKRHALLLALTGALV